MKFTFGELGISHHAVFFQADLDPYIRYGLNITAQHCGMHRMEMLQ